MHTSTSGLGNAAWPSDARLSTRSADDPLLRLLVVHGAISDTGIDLPRTEPPAPETNTSFADIRGEDWREHWCQTWEWYDKDRPDPLSPPPTLSGANTEQFFSSEPYEQWVETVDKSADILNDELDQQVRGALLAAMKRGLRQVVVVPLAGNYGEQFGEHCLAVSASLRADADAYRSTLDAFST